MDKKILKGQDLVMFDMIVKASWNERWYCHRYGTYKNVTGENPNKKSRLAQKETKKCDCESYFFIIGTLKRQRVFFFSAVFF